MILSSLLNIVVFGGLLDVADGALNSVRGLVILALFIFAVIAVIGVWRATNGAIVPAALTLIAGLTIWWAASNPDEITRLVSEDIFNLGGFIGVPGVF